MRLIVLAACAALVLAFSTCSTPKNTLVIQAAAPAPEWVTSRPHSSSYYIGIGQSTIAPGVDYQAVAKKNALNDLASEIKVKVSSQSILYTLEREYKFTEEFSETINTSTNLELEDYEQLDSWQDGSTYWVFYRLGRESYARAIAAKKAEATAMALALYQQAKEDAAAGKFNLAATGYLEALRNLQKFMREPIPAVSHGDTLQLGTSLLLELRTLFAEVQLITVPSAGINLNYFNNYSQTVEIKCISPSRQTPVSGVPLSYRYYGSSGIIRGAQATPVDGVINLLVTDADFENTRNALQIELDKTVLNSWASGDEFLITVINKLQAPSAVLSVAYVAPAIYITGSETNLGHQQEKNLIQSAIKSILLKHNVPVVNDSKEAQLVLNVAAKTTKGTSDDGFFITYLDVAISVQDQATGKAAFNRNTTSVKGVSTDFMKAGEKAFSKYLENLSIDLSKPLISSILN